MKDIHIGPTFLFSLWILVWNKRYTDNYDNKWLWRVDMNVFTVHKHLDSNTSYWLSFNIKNESFRKYLYA